MIRLLLVIVVMMALPVGVYILWRIFLSSDARAGKVDSLDPESLPWRWLLPIGAVLSAAAIVFLADGFGHGGKEDIYVPAHVEDGKIVPGKLQPRHKAGER